ncbi:MAG: rod shape-determining protein MreC [Candidatus Lernaella stagnicola]|nr:rod shape-determining protein MreC [Candidatus Lernaella stagnicola]
MWRFLGQHRVLLLILLLVLIGLHLLSSGLRQQTELSLVGKIILTVYTPIYKVLSWPFVKIANGIGHYLYLVNVKETNEKLRHQNAVLRGNLVELNELRTANKHLTEILEMKVPNTSPVAYASIIGRGDKTAFHVILLDKGTGGGIVKGMAVVAPSGLVGYVAAVTKRAAKVVLLTDAGARVDSVIQRTREPAMVFGLGKDRCTVHYLESGADVAEGDVLVSSGLGGIFPKGIAVGVIQHVERGEFDVIRNITVAPAVDLDRLEHVAILPSVAADFEGLKP